MRVSRAVTAAAAVAAVVVAAACTPGAGDDGSGASDPATSPGPSLATGTGTPEAPGGSAGSDPTTLDPAYAVEPPGRRTERTTVADVLISSEDTLDPDLVERIRKLDGVEAVATISLANVPMENKVYNLAAVDAGTYRLFTGDADFQEAWERVAAGEVAVAADLTDQVPADDQQFLRLSKEPAGTVHIGAWVRQPEQIDLVVNAKRGEALGMVPDNALLVFTGSTAPEALKEPISDVVGREASVQNLDAVARFGLDPDAFESAVLVGDFADAVGVFTYTPAGGGRITPDPAWVASHIVTETVPILGSVTCNKFLMPQLKAALAEVVTRGLADEIDPDQYAGCYYPRYIAGSTTLSNHSFGLALDLNTPGNQRGTVGEMNREVVAIFKYWGFAWGGDWRYTDPMHFELSQLKAPAAG